MKHIVLSFLLAVVPSISAAAAYQKATESKENVLDKLYPKKGRIEVNPVVGTILNQAYVSSILFGAGVSYFWKETAGISLDFQMALNSDRGERSCIENFFLDPKNAVAATCDPLQEGLLGPEDAEGFPRYGPAYVPIREINNIFAANYVWNPVYGKQLVFLSMTSYFDLFFEFGTGVAMSNFYPERNVLNNGNVPRAPYIIDENDPTANANVGAKADEIDSYGVLGRPIALAETNPIINLGVGQKLHFGKYFHILATVRNMTLLLSSQGFENYFTITGGVGVRF